MNVTPADGRENENYDQSWPNSGLAKKQRRRDLQPKRESPKKEQKKMGIFYAKNPSKKIAHLFQPGIDAYPKFIWMWQTL